MAGGIDTSKRKPRRVFGTPSYKIRNRFALVIAGIGASIGTLIIAVTPDSTRERWDKYIFAQSETEIERKARMSLTSPPSIEILKQALEEKQDE